MALRGTAFAVSRNAWDAYPEFTTNIADHILQRIAMDLKIHINFCICKRFGILMVPIGPCPTG
jgi:hypothetical protein